MLGEDLNDVEVASPSVVRQAACDFAAALAEIPQFVAFETAADRLKHDLKRKKAIEAFQTKQQSLQMMLRLNAVSPEDQAELEQLHQALLSEPSVNAYFEAQTELIPICQAAAELISKSIGLDYAAACGASCCG